MKRSVMENQLPDELAGCGSGVGNPLTLYGCGCGYYNSTGAGSGVGSAQLITGESLDYGSSSIYMGLSGRGWDVNGGEPWNT